MGLEEGFLQEIREHPEDDEPRLIFADWLEDHGQCDRATVFRLQCETAGFTGLDRSQEWKELKARDLIEANRKTWIGSPPKSLQVQVKRGMLQVEAEGAHLTKVGAQKWWKRYSPWIDQVNLNGSGEELQEPEVHDLVQSVPCWDINGIQLTSSILNALAQFSGLRSLRMHTDHLPSYHGLPGIRDAENLRSLHFTVRDFKKKFRQDLEKMTQLTSLTLDVKAKVNEVRYLEWLPAVKDLTLNLPGELTYSTLAPLANLEQMEKMYLYYGDDPGSGLEHLAQCPALRNLKISHILLSADTVRALPAFEQIELLRLCPTHRVGEGWMKSISNLKKLKHIDVSESDFIREGDLDYLVGLPDLESLDLDHTNVKGDDIKTVAKCKGLKRLFYTSGRFPEKSARQLRNLDQLTSLDLRDSTTTDKCLVHLAEMKSLRWINLSGSKVTKPGVKKLKQALPEAYVEHYG